MVQGMEDLSREGSSRGEDCGAGHGSLGYSRAAHDLRRALTAAAGHEAQPLFDPDSKLANAADMPYGDRRKWQEGRCGCTLELARAHLAPQAAVVPPASDAGAHVRTRQPCIVFGSSSSRIGRESARPKITHAPGRVDDRDAIELCVCAASCRTYLSEREAQHVGCRDRTDPVTRHDRKDLALPRIEVGHQVGGASEAVPLLECVEGIRFSGCLLRGKIEVDTPPRAKAGEVPAFAVSSAPMTHGKPERTDEVVVVCDSPWRHDDGRDRVVDDLLLGVGRDSLALAAPSQLTDQLATTSVQLGRRVLR